MLDFRLTAHGRKRGFASLNGFVAGISTYTGRIIDVQPMSRYCQVCVTAVNFKETDPGKYISIMDDHDCTETHDGTAPAMETTGSQTIFNRSIEKQLRYTEFYGDGDSKGGTLLIKEDIGEVFLRTYLKLVTH